MAIVKRYSFIQLAEDFANKFAEPIPTIEYTLNTASSDAFYNTPLAMDKSFSLAGLRRALCNCKRKSAPGADRITHQALKSIDPSMHNKLLESYNKVWSSGSIPDT